MADLILETVLKDQCRQLHLPSVAARSMSLEQEAVRTGLRHSHYLSSLLEQELEDRAQRRAQRRIVEARFPQVKRLSDFRFEDAPAVSATQIAQLADGTYIERAENVLLMGDSGTGKSMLATGLGVAACEQGRSVRFDLMVADELGYVSLPASGAELLFQVLAQRSETGSIIATSNLPFSEWTSVFPDPRLCKAAVQRLTFRSHIIQTGTESYRFKRSLARSQTGRQPSPEPTPVTKAGPPADA
jgi:DNA replication protein DnaC